MGGGAVLHLVDEELGFGAVEVGAVELLDPVAHFVQVGGARGDHQYGVDALDGHDAQGAEQRAAFAQGIGADGGVGLAGCGGLGRGALAGPARGRRSGCGNCSTRGATRKQAQRGLNFGWRGVLEREHANRHAAQQVDVEGVDHVEPAFGFDPGAAHDEDVADGIDAHDGVGRHHGPQDVGHFRRAKVLQRDDNRTIAGCQGAAVGQTGGCNDAAQRLGRADVVSAARVARHDDAVELQRAFEQEHGLVGADVATRDEGDGAVQRRVNDVVDLEQVAQHDVDDFAYRRVLELEAAGRTLHGAASLAGGKQAVVTTDQDGLTLGVGIGGGRQRRGFGRRGQDRRRLRRLDRGRQGRAGQRHLVGWWVAGASCQLAQQDQDKQRGVRAWQGNVGHERQVQKEFEKPATGQGRRADGAAGVRFGGRVGARAEAAAGPAPAASGGDA